MTPQTRFLPAVVLAACCALSSATARADVTTEQRTRAAQAFDAGVKHFQAAEYVEAARAFLLADELLANSQALSNAIAAARRANEDLLVAKAAQRAIDRAAADPELGASAREALAEAERHLARIELRCEPQPCTLKVDGEEAVAGKRYLLPGTHVLVADAERNAQAIERLTLVAGAAYRVVLYPTPRSVDAKPASVTDEAGKPASGRAPPKAKEGSATPATEPSSGAAEPQRKPLPPAVVYGGAGVTAVLLGVTIWSGLDAISAKSDLGSDPTTAQVDDVQSKITRSNILLGATAVVGIATTVVGFTLVDWKHGQASASVSPHPGGAVFGAQGTF
jgi:hypothetical protein